MKKNLNLSSGFAASASISELEQLGWDFAKIYKDIALIMNSVSEWDSDVEITDDEIKESEEWTKKHYHVRFRNRGYGLYWILVHNQSGNYRGSNNRCDDEKSREDIQHRYDEGLIWDIVEGNKLESLGSLHKCLLNNEEKAFCYENNEGKLFVTFLVVDDILREDFNLQVNYCPTCGYEAKNLIK